MMLVIEGLGLLAALSDGLGGEDIETGLVVVASKTKTKAKKATSVRRTDEDFIENKQEK